MSQQLPNWHQEVIDLHQFFQDWFRAELPKTEEAFNRFSKVMHSSFHIISPRGQMASREQIVSALFNAHGQSPTVKIWIEKAQLHFEGEKQLIVTYHEMQTVDGDETDRISTAVFQHDPDGPNQLTWLHVHETWADS